jgi:hypothetical protein
MDWLAFTVEITKALASPCRICLFDGDPLDGEKKGTSGFASLKQSRTTSLGN